VIGLGLGLELGSQSGGGAVSPVDALAARAATVAVYNWPNPATMTAGDGGAVVQGDSDTIATVPNAKTPGSWDQSQTTAAYRPIYDNGAVFDGTNDNMFITLPGTRPASATLVMIVKSTDNVDAMLIGTTSLSHYVARAVDASVAASNAGMGTLTFRKNGVGVTAGTRDQVADLFLNGVASVMTVQAVNLTNMAYSDIRIGQSGAVPPASNGAGRFLLVAVLDAAQADHATALADAEALASAQIAGLGL